VLSIVAIVVAPYLKTKTPPDSSILKLVVASLATVPLMFPVPPLAVGRAPLSVIFGVVPPEEAKGDEAVTEVTVPEPAPAPIAVRKSAALKAETVLSALKRGNVTALGSVIVNRFAPSVVAPRLVRAPDADDAPVPPSVIAKSVPSVSEDKYVIAATTNFSIEESGGLLVFKYGATTIATMDSTGNLTTLNNVTAYGSI